jgi:hypothetical protein
MSLLLTAVAAAARELGRTNFAGRRVTLAEGVAVGAGAVRCLVRHDLVADAAGIGGVFVLGLADDLVEPRRRAAGAQVSKGLRGHLGALRSGRLTTGAAKAIGIPVLCVLQAAAARARRGERDRSTGATSGTSPLVAIVLDGALGAASANMVNLLDLRPGRALKALVPAALVLAFTGRGEARTLAATAAGIGALALPIDLREKGMLGDTGANVLGALVGASAARALPVPSRVGLLGLLVGLTVVSERVSFSAVIESTPALRRLDQWGRRS